jgi:hypothetical protein
MALAELQGRFDPDAYSRSTGDEIKALQRNLQTQGLYLGEIDGTWSPAVREAQIKAIQSFLQRENIYRGRIDGNWGVATRAALEEYRRRNPDALRDANSLLSAARARETKDDTALEGLVRQHNVDLVRANRPLWQGFATDYSPLVLAAGGAVGGGARMFRNWLSNRGSRHAAEEANALINPAQPLPGRIANMDEFFRRGGGNRAYIPDTTMPHGVRPAGNQNVSGLFRSPSWRQQRINVEDVAAATVPSAIGVRNELMIVPEARAAYERARAEHDRRGSRESAENLQRAEAAYAMALVSARTLEAFGPAYLAMGLRGRRFTSPNLGRAGQEVLDINAAIRPPTTWSSPAGRLTVTFDPAIGRFRDTRGRTFTEAELRRKGWARNP